MSSPVPRILLNKGRIHASCSVLAPVQDWSVEALYASEPHYRLRNGAWSGGGPFYCWKTRVNHTSKPIVMTRNDVTYHATPAGSTGGGIQVSIPKSFQSLNIPSYNSASADLSGHYAKGYARTRPGNPVAGVGQFLAELRDLPSAPIKGIWKVPISEVPRLLYKRLSDFRNLGSEYLNIQFGWIPFVSDLRKMYNLWKTIDKKMAQLVRENGRYIRRRATIEDTSSSTLTSFSYGYPYALVYCQPPTYASGSTYHTVRTSTKTRIWFVGSFRYYIPDTSSSMWDARARLALFGALPTPEVLWEVMPWSWLIDWFSNVGDIVSNASMNAVDNLTLRYSYIMKHVTTTVEASSDVFHTGEHVSGSNPRVVKGWDENSFMYRSTQKTESKIRRGGGNPFGLDVQFNSLSDYQLSILAALGISRSAVR